MRGREACVAWWCAWWGMRKNSGCQASGMHSTGMLFFLNGSFFTRKFSHERIHICLVDLWCIHTVSLRGPGPTPGPGRMAL